MLSNFVETDSPLTRLLLEQASRWREFQDRYLDEYSILRWMPDHRVYRCGERVLKVEWIPSESDDPCRVLKYEYSLMKKLEGRAIDLNPEYRTIDDRWAIIEMDWIDGEYLSRIIHEGRGRSVSLFGILHRLFQVSMAGVIYKQLRPRHIILRPDGELTFIDFGHSDNASPVVALWRNFAPLTVRNGSWQWGRVIGLVAQVRRRRSGDVLARNALQSAQRSWRSNSSRKSQQMPKYLEASLGDPVASGQLESMEECLSDVASRNPDLTEDFCTLHFGTYYLNGNRDWCLIWSYIVQRVDFRGKRLVDIGCAMGCAGVFALLEGAKSVLSLESDPTLLKAAGHLSAALGLTHHDFSTFDWPDFATGNEVLPKADIVSALSARFDQLPLGRVMGYLGSYPEILWQTSRPDEARRLLEERGYKVESLVETYMGRFLLYAVSR